MKLRKLINRLTKWEKVTLTILILVLVFSAYRIGRAFYLEHSETQFVPGGVYVEGAVGELGILNPLFVQQGTVTHDIVELIFSGLTKFDTDSGEIVGDLANVKVDSSGKEYTFVLKDGATWHDGEPVTANDVLFTYNDVIKNPEFSGNILNYNDYTGIKVTKIDDRTVQFLLEKPDSFFLVKTMVGILPQHLLENEPVAYLDSSPFNYAPIGTGPYRYVSEVPFADNTEIGLEAYEDFYDGKPNIDSVLYKVFDSFDDLKKNLSKISAVRTVPNSEEDFFLKRDRFALERYQLPQYVAVFINSEAPKLKESGVRLALQLGTDKESLVQKINEVKIIDTPLLEIDQENWIHQYSVKKANGALYETQWQIPNKEEVIPEEEQEDEEEPEQDPTVTVTNINSPNGGKNWTTTQDTITITGTAPANTKAIIINDYELQKFTPGDSGWSYVASTRFDNLKAGENIYEVYALDFNEEKTLLDAIKITFGSATSSSASEEEAAKLKEENEQASPLPTRVNDDGEPLVLNLITSERPEVYGQVAQIIAEQWKKIGVELDIEVLPNQQLQERLSNREYDLLIFGQNLGYNLDAYPYWHSSQAIEGGLNLSQFKNFVVDSLLEKARLESDENRQKTLNDIQRIISQEVPAIFLYSPTYYTALSKNIKNAPFQHLATTTDRLNNIETWYAKADRRLRDDVNFFTFFPWLLKQF